VAKDLELWMDRLATKLREDVTVEVAAGDKLFGSVIELLVTIDDAYCEIVVVRSKRKHAHVAVFAERKAVAERLAELLGFAYRGIGRFRNAERKLVHRIERCAKSLVAGWDNQMNAFPAEPLARVGTAFGSDVRAMCGRGYHVHVPGLSDDHEKHRYDPLYAVSVKAGERRRALVYNPGTKQFLAPSVLGPLLPPAAAAAGVQVADDRETIGDVALEATSEVCCELPDWIPDSSCDAGDCVPDCGSFDLPDCDIGGCDL